MKLIKVFFVFLIQLLDIFMASPVPALYMETPVQFCGQQLAVELSIICKGRYNEARGNGHRRHKRGIIDDCCLKTCTRQYVKINYCGPEPAEPKITKPAETTTTSRPKKINKVPLKGGDFLTQYFNNAWTFFEEIGLISVPSDHQRPIKH